jgi:HK97 gp10 family phage protein
MALSVTLAPGWKDALVRESLSEREAAINRAVSAAKAICPVDTGRLVASIEGEVDPSSMAMRLSAGDEAEVNYAGYVELGTRYMAAQPYLRPALTAIDH